MKTRAITGFFFVVVMLASVLLNHWVFGGFYLALSSFCLWEFYSLIKQTGADLSRYPGILNGIVVYVVCVLISVSDNDAFNNLLVLSLVPFVVAVFGFELFKKSATPFLNIAYTFLGIILIVIPFSFFHALAYLGILKEFNFHYPLAFLLMLWSNDTGAYLTGRAFGRHKLFERHSPKKTWEGFIGGVLIAAGIGVILGRFYFELSSLQWAVMGGIIGVAGTMGDLVESMFKRSINVKDSGGILPGHGGWLDRFDGLFLAVPVVYAYLYLIINS